MEFVRQILTTGFFLAMEAKENSNQKNSYQAFISDYNLKVRDIAEKFGSRTPVGFLGQFTVTTATKESEKFSTICHSLN